MLIEWWVVLATLAGPVVAVQTQKWVERASERRNRKTLIFSTLMANRATQLADDFVRALNSIDLVFLPKWWWFPKKDRVVISAWRALFDEYSHGPIEGETERQIVAAWNTRVADRLTDLLSAMTLSLGYSFSNEELRRGIYYPKGHVEREQTQMAILFGLRAILEGKISLPMRLTEAPTSPEAAELQKQLTERMVSAYCDDGALKVRISSDRP